jgi:ABC-2 type transport system permease protein
VIRVALGSCLSNQVAAIVVILVFTQFVEPVARVVLSQVEGLRTVAGFLPGGAE